MAHRLHKTSASGFAAGPCVAILHTLATSLGRRCSALESTMPSGEPSMTAKNLAASTANTRLSAALALAFGTWGLMSAGDALAQAAPAAQQQAASGELTTITVTANRRIEDQQKVGVSVTALGSEKLAERNIVDLSQIEGLSPGFTFGRSGVDARPAIRGVRTENVAVNADTTIGFFVDGIYKSRAQQAMLGFVDVGRVEIQRGPQGTLFGRNTFGGNIVISTNAP
ncbi:MAG: TonB-dependent receptor plug domain-containing protein, partial [Rubrivivax sp.]